MCKQEGVRGCYKVVIREELVGDLVRGKELEVVIIRRTELGSRVNYLLD